MVDQLNQEPYMLSCDWGTSSFRLRLVDTATCDSVASLESDAGIGKVFNAWTAEQNSKERIPFYLSQLLVEIRWLSEKTGENLDGIPVVVSGMASSSIGMKELPYAPLPFSLERPDLELYRIDAPQAFPHRVLLISGIQSNKDIMRGEETQILGLSLRHDIHNSRCLLPGTHSKHIRIEDNCITRFQTFMTGELFELLSEQSILSNSVAKPTSELNATAFERGVLASREGILLHHLFTIRANDLLHRIPKEEQYDFLSGLLIGTEFAALEEEDTAPLFLLGDSVLHPYYTSALQLLDIPFTALDNTEELAVLGHCFFLQHTEN